MIIKSNFHDYYDNVMSYGRDTSLMYLRFPKIIPHYYPFRVVQNYHPSISLENFVIGFCGKFYPGVKLTDNKSFSTYRYCYHMSDCDGFVHSYLTKKDIKLYYDGNHNTSKWNPPLRTRLEEYFTKAVTDYFDDTIFITHRVPLFVFTRYSYYHNQYKPNDIEINCNLSKYEFMRVFDHFSTYQEISMYLGGMAMPEKPIPKIEDKTMVEIKGFDRFSFRKPKSK